MKRDEVHLMLERYADGTLGEEDAQRLLGALQDEVVAGEVQRELKMIRLLHRHEAERDGETFRRSLVERLNAANDGERFVESWTREDGPLDQLATQSTQSTRRTASTMRHPLRRRRSSSAGAWVALAAILTLAAIGVWVASEFGGEKGGAVIVDTGVDDGVTVARVDRVNGAVTLRRSDGDVTPRVGVALGAGDELECASRASLRLRYADGTVVDVEGGTTLALGGSASAKQLKLRRGRIAADVAKQAVGSPFVLTTANATSTVLGTRFTLTSEPSRSRLEVTEGRVRFERASDKANVEVPAGHYAVVAPDEELVVRELSPRITGFVLLNAESDRDIGPLRDGDVIDLSKIGTSLNIRVDTIGGVKSVRFELDGELTQLEDVALYSMMGDTEGDYKSWTPTPGEHVLIATPYAEHKGKGTPGEPARVRFRVTGDGAATSEPIELEPIADVTVEDGRVRNDKHLKVENSSERQRQAFLRFDTRETAGRQIKRAVLKLRAVQDGGGGTLRLSRAGPADWAESARRLADLPKPGLELDRFTGRVPEGRLVRFDVTRAVTGGGVLTFVITSDRASTADDVWFHSRDGGDRGPRLRIEY